MTIPLKLLVPALTFLFLAGLLWRHHLRAWDRERAAHRAEIRKMSERTSERYDKLSQYADRLQNELRSRGIPLPGTPDQIPDFSNRTAVEKWLDD